MTPVVGRSRLRNLERVALQRGRHVDELAGEHLVGEPQIDRYLVITEPNAR